MNRFTTRGRVLLLAVIGMVAGLLAVPTIAAAADPPWMDTSLSPDQRADLLAAAMSLDQKILLFSPDPQQAIPELGIPARREVDGGTGVTATGAATTAFPAGLALASTWDPSLAAAFGQQGGQEARLTGYSGWAAPSADLLRNPFFGRQWSSYGEDPVLGGLLPGAVVQGLNRNQGVYALPKHWLVNTQETQRQTENNVVDERTLRELYVRQWEPIVQAGPGAVMCAFPKVNGQYACENPHLLQDVLKGDLAFPGWVSSDFNACHTFGAFTAGADVCGPAFPTQDQLRQAVVDGTIPAARFDDMVHRILRTYFARGLIDNPPPGSLVNPKPAPDPLPAEVVARGRDIAYRIAVDGSVLLRNRAAALPLNTNGLGSVAVIGEGADRYISGFGADFVRNPTAVTPILDGITSRAGAGVTVTHAEGTDPVRVGDLMPGAQPVPSSVLTPATGTGAGLTAEWFTNPSFEGTPSTTRVEDQVNWGQGLAALFSTFGSEPSPAPKLPSEMIGAPTPSARWTGSLNPVVTGTYQLGVTVLGTVRVFLDGQQILSRHTDRIGTAAVPVDLVAGSRHDVRIEYVADAPNQCCPGVQEIGPAIRFSWTPPAPAATPAIRAAVAAARTADVAVVVADDYMGESLDRGSLSLPQNQDQLIRAVARANPNTIVVLTTGSAVTMPWLNQVAGVMESWYPGGEQGRAVAALLFGDERFSGKLPISWPRSEEQVTGGLGIDNPYFDINNPGVTVPHDEGIYTGYRGFDRAGLEPLFPFGYGLTTGTVAYRNVQIRDPRQAAAGRPQTGRDGLVRVRVQNTGAAATTETVQLYEGKLPTAADTPARQLIGWSRVTLAPRETRWVDIPVKLGTTQHALAYWDTGANAWVTPTGRTSVYIGRSERDIRLTGNITVLAPPGA